jgi:hypothetical protein
VVDRGTSGAASSRARNPPTFRLCSQPNSSSSSICKRRERSASKFRGTSHRSERAAWRLGRDSFNPLMHIDPFGTVVLPLMLLMFRSPFLFGYAKPVPVNFRALHHPRLGTILVAPRKELTYFSPVIGDISLWIDRHRGFCCDCVAAFAGPFVDRVVTGRRHRNDLCTRILATPSGHARQRAACLGLVAVEIGRCSTPSALDRHNARRLHCEPSRCRFGMSWPQRPSDPAEPSPVSHGQGSDNRTPRPARQAAMPVVSILSPASRAGGGLYPGNGR